MLYMYQLLSLSVKNLKLSNLGTKYERKLATIESESENSYNFRAKSKGEFETD